MSTDALSTQILDVQVNSFFYRGPEARTYFGTAIGRDERVVIKQYPAAHRRIALHEAMALMTTNERCPSVAPELLGVYGGNEAGESITLVSRRCGTAARSFDAIPSNDK